LCDRYSCHLHINLDERYRNRGFGSALIAAFAAQAASAGHSGIHVVTEEQARNIRFFSLGMPCNNDALTRPTTSSDNAARRRILFVVTLRRRSASADKRRYYPGDG
jgi:GNAT superfamily N-acetyltransferase